ncbi:hypothetical protein [Streptomyces sp. NPDC001388]|uniref:hypothetical protein n=1 Tax=Streptomyces sp. NPDC001388 TaxID=3364568 RepID=UPI00368BFCBC
MNTGLRITAFAAALTAAFDTACGVGGTVDAISPERLEISQGGRTLDLKTPREAGRKAEATEDEAAEDEAGRAH